MNTDLFDGIRVETLPCGLRVGVFPRGGFRRSYGLLAVGFGALDRLLEAPGGGQKMDLPGGCAHFIEHQLFSAGEEDFAETFSVLGAEANAYTSHTETAYYFSCVDGFAQCLAALLRLVVPPAFAAEGVEREKRIIAHELAEYREEPENIIFTAQMRALYGDHPLAEDIAGTAQALESINADLLQDAAARAYSPANMCLVLAGAFDSAQEIDRVADLCSGWQAGPATRVSREVAIAQPQSVEIRSPLEHTRLSWGWADPLAGINGEALARRELALDLALDLCFGAASSFYHRAYAEGVIDWDSFGYEVHADPAFIHCLVGGESKDPEALERQIEESLDTTAGTEPSQEALGRLRRKAYGHLVQRFDQLEACGAFVGRCLALQIEPAAFLQIYRSVGFDQITECLHGLRKVGAHAAARVWGER